jgi:hypothetical protein
MHTYTAHLIVLIVVQTELKDTNLKNNPPMVILVKFLSLSTSERLAYKDSQSNSMSKLPLKAWLLKEENLSCQNRIDRINVMLIFVFTFPESFILIIR